MSIEKTLETLAHDELSDADIVYLLGLTAPEECELLRKAAYDRTTELMGNFVYYRGLIEFSNICTASCRYCGIRRENHDVARYTMSKEEIVAAAKWAAEQGYGSICLQSGERRDEKYVAFVEECLEAIHEATVSEQLPDGVGVTLSLGEQTIETYRAPREGFRQSLQPALPGRALKPRTRNSSRCSTARAATTRRSFRTASACFATCARRATRWAPAS